MVLADREVVQIERILRVRRAAQAAIARVITGQLFAAAVRVAPPRPGVNRDAHQLRLAAGRSARVAKDLRADRQMTAIGRGKRRRVKHLVREPVIGVKRLQTDRRRPPRIIENARRRANMHVEVMQRPTTDAAAMDHVHPVEHAVLDQTEPPRLHVPKSLARDLSRRTRKPRPRPTPPTLQHAHRETSLRKTARGDAAPEARANDHVVIPFVHHLPPLSNKPASRLRPARPTGTPAMNRRNPRPFSTLDTGSSSMSAQYTACASM